jgi:hypothetical protein
VPAGSVLVSSVHTFRQKLTKIKKRVSLTLLKKKKNGGGWVSVDIYRVGRVNGKTGLVGTMEKQMYNSWGLIGRY